jgi:hypothetical protein
MFIVIQDVGETLVGIGRRCWKRSDLVKRRSGLAIDEEPVRCAHSKFLPYGTIRLDVDKPMFESLGFTGWPQIDRKVGVK